MKTTVISTLAFAFAGITLATPVARDSKRLELTTLSVKNLTESDTGRIDFTILDPSDNAQTTCSDAWNVGGPSASVWFACEDSSFTFNFPSGISSIEDFQIMVHHNSIIAQATLNALAGASVYTCQTPGATPGTSEECDLGSGEVITAESIY